MSDTSSSEDSAPNESGEEEDVERMEGATGTLRVVAHAHEPLPRQTVAQYQPARVQERLAHRAQRVGNAWCHCGECIPQDNADNRYCCQEEERIVGKMVEGIRCITQHPGFSPIMENVHVLEVAYIEYRTTNEPIDAPIHKKFRYCAYRQFIRWIWKKLGLFHRKPLPSCVMKRVRSTFPSEDGIYTGYKHVPLLD